MVADSIKTPCVGDPKVNGIPLVTELKRKIVCSRSNEIAEIRTNVALVVFGKNSIFQGSYVKALIDNDFNIQISMPIHRVVLSVN